MIAPHFEKLAKEHSRPKKMAFAKVNVDNQSTIARSNGVAAMPTFMIFHGGKCVETIKGANPPALTEAITKAAKLADMGAEGKASEVFQTPGRTLGGPGAGAGGNNNPQGSGFNISSVINILIAFVGLYLWSLFSARSQKEE
jgi:thiol-disulfide isomerase/thioredoxin